MRYVYQVRPFMGYEKGQSECVACTENQDGTGTVSVGETKNFVFDYVFPMTATQVRLSINHSSNQIGMDKHELIV